MKKITYLVITLLAMAMMPSCGNKVEQEQITREDSINTELNDSLATAIAEKDSLMALMNDISDGMNRLKELQDVVSVSNLSGETPDRKAQLRSDMELLQKSVAERKKRLEDLEKRLSQSRSYNDEMRKTAILNCDTYGVPADFRTMDAHHLEFGDGTFDLVVSRDVLWNLDDPARVYEEMYRVLRPGGKLIVFDGNFYLYAHDPAYESMNVERHIEIYHKDEPDCRERLLRVADMATKLPASKDRRPQWDMNQLVCLGAERVSAVSYPENRIEITENGKRSYLPFTFAVSGFKG